MPPLPEPVEIPDSELLSLPGEAPSPSAGVRKLLEVAGEIGFGHDSLVREWQHLLRHDVRAAADPDKDAVTRDLLVAWESTAADSPESPRRDGELRELVAALAGAGPSVLDARRRACDRLRSRGLARLSAGDVAGAMADLRAAAEASLDPWTAKADLARAEAAGGDPDRARGLELEVARHAIAAGRPEEATSAIDRLLSRPGADRRTSGLAWLLRARAALVLACSEAETARRSRILRDVIESGCVRAIDAFVALGDAPSFAEGVALLGQAYREIAEDGRLRQLPALITRRYPARAAEIDAALHPILESVASTATIGIARDPSGELLLPEGAQIDVLLESGETRGVDALPIRVPVVGAPAARSRVRAQVRLKDGRRIDLPQRLAAGDNVRLDVRLAAKGFVFVPHEGEADPPRSSTPGFYIQRTEVTNAEFAAFLRSDGASDLRRLAGERGETFLLAWRRAPRKRPSEIEHREGEGDHPVTFVSPSEAKRYAAWRASTSAIDGLRLPSDTEWTAAAAGPDRYLFPWGETWAEDRCNGFEDDDVGGTAAVDTLRLGESPCGALHMAGNVSEIVESEPEIFVARGGSYRNRRTALAPSPEQFVGSRRPLFAGERDIDVGFRCVAPAPGAPAFRDGMGDDAIAGGRVEEGR